MPLGLGKVGPAGARSIAEETRGVDDCPVSFSRTIEGGCLGTQDQEGIYKLTLL